MELSTQEKQRLKQQYGEWALITGASSGIGFEVARLLASAGLNLVLNAQHADRLEQAAAQIRAMSTVKVITVAANLAEEAGVRALISHSQDMPLGLLVLSAGYGTSGLLVDADVTQERDMLRVNAEAPLVLAQHYSRQFGKNRKGGIIFLSSIVAFQGVPYAAHYAATKAYIQSLAEGLAQELKPYNVDVLAAAPGPVATRFGERSNLKMGMALKADEVAVSILHALGRKTTVLPGFLSKLLVYSLRTLPRWGKVKVMGTVMGGMTQHQR